MSLIFLTNELISPRIQREMHVPLKFVAFGHINAKMYKHYRRDSTFILPSTKCVTYGGLFFLKDAEFYYRILDAYNLCSMSTLRKNHKNDIHHRVDAEVTLIRFNTVDELERLKYAEDGIWNVQTYIGNITHPKINQRLNKTNGYRVSNDLDKHYMELIREELL